MQIDTDELGIGTYVHASTGTGSWNGLVAQTFPNNHVLVLTTSGGHYVIAPRENVRVIPEETFHPEALTLRLNRELREKMGLPRDMPKTS